MLGPWAMSDPPVPVQTIHRDRHIWWWDSAAGWICHWHRKGTLSRLGSEEIQRKPVVENVETSPYYWPLLIKTTRKLSTIETRLMRVDFATKWNWRSTSCSPCLLQCLEWFSTAAADSCPGWKSALSMVYLCRTALSLPEILENHHLQSSHVVPFSFWGMQS